MAEEKNFENRIKKYLNEKDCWYVKYFANRMTKSGVPDILACVNGQFMAIEVKASKGHPSELQIYHRDKIRETGGIAVIVYPDQWEKLKHLINLLDNGNTFAAELQYEFDRKEV
jgi:RecB family endonuclease NucS